MHALIKFAGSGGPPHIDAEIANKVSSERDCRTDASMNIRECGLMVQSQLLLWCESIREARIGSVGL